MLNKNERLELYSHIKHELAQWSDCDVENAIMTYCFNSLNIKYEFQGNNINKIIDILSKYNMPTDLESIVEFFEFLIKQENKDENGVVFTPKYISDYIVSNLLSGIEEFDPNTTIIDPGCGGGIFLASAAEYLHKKYNIRIESVINNNICGIELDENIARRCKLILLFLTAQYGGDYHAVSPQVVCADSLKTSWTALFNHIDHFDYIIGNPPYVNPHDMNKETVSFLKSNFTTTKKGVFNIFYAFIEQSMKFLGECGRLGFIVPNNFLTIKSAANLREFIQKHMYLNTILDFGDNMVFRPVRTYNCIMLLDKSPSTDQFKFYVMPRTDDIEGEINKGISFLEMPKDKLDSNGWKLVDKKTHDNIVKIEQQMISIKRFIRTGIATLRDGVYMVEADNHGFYKYINGEKYYIEGGLVKPIYKISELKLHDNISDAQRYIIFPYVKTTNGYVLIDEDSFKKSYPKTYNVLLENKTELDSRDKGKKNAAGWYAYGRTQGLNKYGKKLLFPTFANHPRFTYLDNEDALFCNGYAIFENDTFELDVLEKILNSYVMDYYVSNTSYSIEGGYYCYQKKYIENFSIPRLTEDDIAFIKAHTGNELDSFLCEMYSITT